MRSSAVFLLLVTLGAILAPRDALAHPPPEPDDPVDHRPALEWSTWFRAAMGMRPREVTTATRVTTPPAERKGQDTAYELALGGDMTIGVAMHEDLRVGPWMELRGTTSLVPRTIDMFLYRGQGVLALRAGGNARRVTGQIAYGYLAPWDLFGTAHGDSRYMIGVRFVASYTRAVEDPRDWLATIGIEVEPVGALRYLLGIRSWY